MTSDAPATLPTAPRATPQFAVPAGLFAPQRRPLFPLFDAIGDPTVVDHTWLDDCTDETVYVSSENAAAFRDYLCLYLPDILTAEAVPLADRAWAMHRALAHEVGFLYAGGGDHPRPNKLTTICRHAATFMLTLRDPDVLFQSLRGEVAYSPVLHGVETAIGTLALAIADGLRVRDHLAILAAGATFADSGMLDLPPAILNSRGPLSRGDRKAVEWHPELSARRMRAIGIVVHGAQLAVRSHHERWDGSGYPDHLAGEDIPHGARYVAVADVYSTLTVGRRGMPRLSRGDALREMAGSAGQFDPSILRILVHLLTNHARREAADERVPSAVAA